MARKKQRENYGNGSVFPVMVNKLDANGNVVIGKDGKPVKVQERDKQGRLIWRVCVTLGTEEYTDKSGKRRKRQKKAPQKRVHGTLDDARRVAKETTDAYEHVNIDSARDEFSAVVASWLAMAETSNICGKDQLRQYKRHLAMMAEYLDGKPVIEVKKADVEKALAAVKKAHGFSNTTMHVIHQQTKRLFEYAVDSDMVLRNPCRAIMAPKVDKVVTRRSLTADEAARLRACLDRDELAAYKDFADKEQRQADWANARPNQTKTFTRSALRGMSRISSLIAVRVMLASGCRRGESLALTWGCVDFDNSQIVIRRTLNQRGELKEPKTGASRRSLFMDADTMAHLKKWKAFQASAISLVMVEDANGNKRPGKQTDETPVCCSDMGGWYDPTNLYRWWAGEKGKAGYRDSIGFPGLKMHELRHTTATLLLGNGVDVKTVQNRLGHASSALTLDQYAHAIPANDKAAADLMGAICGADAAPSMQVVKSARKTA